MIVPSQPQIEKMVGLALKEQAPQTYKELKTEGKLSTFLAEYAQEMEESYLQAYGEASLKILAESNPQGYEERVKSLHQAQREIWEQTRADWLEFSDPVPPETYASL